jgi:deoxycytidylate deaminase
MIYRNDNKMKITKLVRKPDKSSTKSTQKNPNTGQNQGGNDFVSKNKTEDVLGRDPIIPIADGELFFGFVVPSGINLSEVTRVLKEALSHCKYETIEVSLSDLIEDYSNLNIAGKDEFDRITALMDSGTSLREQSKRGDFIARLAIAGIQIERKKLTGNYKTPAKRRAYILRSFKRPEEVDLFRAVYGKAFNLISVYSSKEERLTALTERISKSSKKRREDVEHLALSLMNRDAEEAKPLGQKVRETFPLADFFLSFGDNAHLKAQVNRFTALVFGDPYGTPTRDEFGMFFAQSAALRSADLSRQVGAAITSQDGEIISVGCNEVPKAGGGLYWTDDVSPKRDKDVGFDKNVKVKAEIIQEMLHRLEQKNLLNTKELGSTLDSVYEALCVNDGGALKDSQILDVIEFGRAVHAEMAAISVAARRGIAVQSAKLFCTTFPCHICARHIVAAGLSEVIYIEPYPKSRTADLYSDSIAFNPTSKVSEKVVFRPFVGVAPRRYFDFFQMVGKRKNTEGDVVLQDSITMLPKAKRFVLSYILLEEDFVGSIGNLITN